MARSVLIKTNTATRLKKLEAILQERIINWGYAVCDAAIRRHVDPTVGFPYPAVGVGLRRDREASLADRVSVYLYLYVMRPRDKS